MKGLPKMGLPMEETLTTSEFKTKDITVTQIKKMARDPDKFYSWICLILNKQIQIAQKEIDPDINTNTVEIDQEEEFLNNWLEFNTSIAKECLSDAMKEMKE